MAKKAKKARKKTARKAPARKAASRPSARRGGSLRNASAGELHAELQRRSRDLKTLESRRAALMEKIDAIDSEIAAINGALGVAPPRARRATGRATSGGGRRRPRNENSLEVALASTLKGKTMGVSEVADAVQKAGYKTTSPNFRTIVNQTLIKSDLIKKTGRGQYTAK